MRTIWKYTIPPQVYIATDYVDFEIPNDSKFLCCDNQRDKVALWFEVNTDSPSKTRRFTVIGTGMQFPNDVHKYLGSCMFDEGRLVLHIYEVDNV